MKAHLLNALSQNEKSLAGADPSAGAVPYIANISPRATNPHTFPAIVKMYNRGNNGAAGGMTSSGYWTSWYTYGNGQNSYIQTCGFAFHNLLQNANTSGTYQSGGPHRAVYSRGGQLGVKGAKSASNNNQNYAPFSTMLVFLKNTTGTGKTQTIQNRYSSYWSSGHDGSGAVLVTPNSATKSGTTSVTFSAPWQLSGTATQTAATSYNITIPANTTVALIQTCSYYYWTSFSSGGYYNGQNFISTNGLTNGIEPDHNMHASALMADNYTEYTAAGATNLSQISSQWRTCARVFGD